MLCIRETTARSVGEKTTGRCNPLNDAVLKDIYSLSVFFPDSS